MNPSRIEQAIDEIYNYVEECKPSKLYPSKVVVDREQLYDLLDELRLHQKKSNAIRKSLQTARVF